MKTETINQGLLAACKAGLKCIAGLTPMTFGNQKLDPIIGKVADDADKIRDQLRSAVSNAEKWPNARLEPQTPETTNRKDWNMNTENQDTKLNGGASVGSKEFVSRLVDRFLMWPLPDSVCADLCATRQGPGRIGTNLLSATEAKEMIEYLLGPALSKDAATKEEGESYTQGFFDGVDHAKSSNAKADGQPTR
jgi:hypothetical protein